MDTTLYLLYLKPMLIGLGISIFLLYIRKTIKEIKDEDRRKILKICNSFSSDEKEILKDFKFEVLKNLSENFTKEEIKNIVIDIKSKNYEDRKHILELLIKKRKEKQFNEIINKY